jgi:hypothetical protein
MSETLSSRRDARKKKASERVQLKQRHSHGQGRYARANKNLANYPLTRDSRVQTAWKKDGKHLVASLPSEPRIALWLPIGADAAHHHAPTAFDMNVLFLLLAVARMQRSNQLRVESYGGILYALHMNPRHSSNLRRLRQSLAYWTMLDVQFNNSCWYFAGSWKIGKERLRNDRKAPVYSKPRKGDKLLAPPIQALNVKQGLALRIDPDWVQQGNRYTVGFALPLPMNASAQNVVLTILASAQHGDGGYARKVRNYCRKIGINDQHNNHMDRLRRALEEAQQYFFDHGGVLEYRIKGDKILFPKVQPIKFGKALKRAPVEAEQPTTQHKPQQERVPLQRKSIEPVEPKVTYSMDDEGNRYRIYHWPDGHVEEEVAA